VATATKWRCEMVKGDEWRWKRMKVKGYMRLK